MNRVSIRHSGLFKQFVRDERGIYAIEFILAVPVLVLLILSAIEFGLIMYASATVDMLTNQAARMGKTGADYGNGTSRTFTANANEGFNTASRRDQHYRTRRVGGSTRVTMRSREAFIRQFVLNGVGPLFEPNRFTVRTRTFAQFQTADFTGATENPYDFGGGGEAVSYEVRYNWRTYSPLFAMLNRGRDIPLVSRAVVMNEEF